MTLGADPSASSDDKCHRRVPVFPTPIESARGKVLLLRTTPHARATPGSPCGGIGRTQPQAGGETRRRAGGCRSAPLDLPGGMRPEAGAEAGERPPRPPPQGLRQGPAWAAEQPPDHGARDSETLQRRGFAPEGKANTTGGHERETPKRTMRIALFLHGEVTSSKMCLPIAARQLSHRRDPSNEGTQTQQAAPSSRAAAE